MPVFIGTSGWQYRDWRDSFYPDGLPQRAWLEHYSRCFQTVEVNNAFYRLPEPKTFAAWAEAAPDDFTFAVKVSRFLTHIKRLKDADEPVARFVDHARNLGPKLGPVLLQLPPNLPADCERLDRALSLFPREWRLAVEFRHPSWFTDETAAVLKARGAALCLADSPKRRTPLWRTADWTFLRFHEGRASPHPCYGRTALRSWAERLAELMSPTADSYVYFNNDTRACAVRDAHVFALAAERAGLHPTRVPAARDVRVVTT